MFGKLLSASIRTWLRVTGRTVDLAKCPWLDGPIGTDYIGEDFYKTYAAANGLETSTPADGGLMKDFTVLGSAAFPHLNPRVQHFYEQTARYKMDVWSESYQPVKFFAKLLIRSVSYEINQLSIPLDPMETSKGMTSEVIRLSDANGNVKLVCWLRKINSSNRVVYAGFYAGIRIGDQPYVRVVFPLPKGNVTVILKPEFLPDGSFRLISDGWKFGGAGYYRVQHHGEGKVKVRMIPLKESIHVYEDEKGILRTDHLFRFWGMRFLKLHYQLIEK